MQNFHDYLILGAGPAGVQMAYFFEKAGYDYLVLDRADHAASFFSHQPRHRILLSINKVHTGIEDEQINFRYDWNSLINDNQEHKFRDYSKKYFPHADDLVKYTNDFVDKFDLKVRYNTTVTRVSKNKENIFELTTQDGMMLSCKYLIVATGVPKGYMPEFEGSDLLETYDAMTIDPENYTNQRVLIVGKGNTAFEVADSLIEHAASIHLTSPRPLKLAWNSHHPGHLRAVNNNFLDTYLLKSQNGLLEAYVNHVRKSEDGKYLVSFKMTRAHGSELENAYDRVILCAGFAFDHSIFDESAKPMLCHEDRLPKMSASWESTNIENMFFAGTLMQSRDYKKTQSSFIHGFRFNVRAMFHILNERNHQQPWPSLQMACTSKEIGTHILERINRSASLWHQPRFMGDVIQLDTKNNTATYLAEVPTDFLKETDLSQHPDYLTISLEYGPDHPDFPFEFDRYADACNAHLNPQLHPIVRRFMGPKLVAEHHILEELEGRWHDDVFTEPLFAFLGKLFNEVDELSAV